MTWPYSRLPDNALLDIAASRLKVKKQGATDARNEWMGDAGEWREFALRRPLRESVEKAGTAETAEGPGEHRAVVGPADHPALAAPGSDNVLVVEMGHLPWAKGEADCVAWWLILR